MFHKLRLKWLYLFVIVLGVLTVSIALVYILRGKAIEDDIIPIIKIDKNATHIHIEDDVTYINIDDDAIYIKIDPRKHTDRDIEILERVITKNPGKKIIFASIADFESLSSEEARRADEWRNALEQVALKVWEEEQIAKGLIVDKPMPDPPCATATDQTPTNKPSRFIMCEGEIIALPSKVSLATTPVDPEEILEEYLIELFSGVYQKESEDGYWSIFSDLKVLNDVTFNNGAVVIDFNKRILQDIGGSESYIVTTMVDQIQWTLFQFAEVKSITLTLDGDCETIGDFLQTGCYTYKRDDWENFAKDLFYKMGLPPIYSLEGKLIKED